jgi:hypothetical protein
VNLPVLHHVRQRFAGWYALLMLLATLGVAGGLALAGMLGDAALDLPASLRAAVPWLLGALPVIALGVTLAAWRRLAEARLARRFEQSDAALGNRLINAVQLAETTGGGGIEELFRRQAVELGRQTAAKLAVWPVVRTGVKQAAAGLGLVLLAWTILPVVEPDLVRTVWPRFSDPHGDHPPFSRLKIAVTANGPEVIYGGQMDIRATTSGRPVEKLWLVMRSATNETRAIMFLAPDKSFFQTLVNLRAPAEYFVTDGAARSRRFPITIRYAPEITSVEVSTIFPEYTSLPAHTGKLAEEAQALPEETRVSFRVTSNRPLKSGALDLTPVLGGQPVRLTLRPAAENVVTGAFVLADPVVFELSVRDIGNLDCTEPKRGRFNILPDRPPRLFVMEPGRDAVATPDIKVPVRVQASDDYAVTRILWLRGFNRSVERPFSMKLTLKNGPQSVEAAGAFELDQLGVRPGDVIEYYFEAVDNYPKGPNVTFSRPYRLQIISPEEYASVLRQAAARKALFEPYFKLDAWQRRLAERARTLAAKADGADPSTRAEAEEIAGQLAQYREALGKLLQDPVMFDVENSFRSTLAAQQAELGDISAKLQAALAGGGVPDAKALKALSDRLNALAQTQDDQVEQPAQQIASVVRLVSQADTFVKLAQEQAVLAQMLGRYADQTDALTHLEQSEVQELTHQEHRISAALHELLGQLPELLRQVPADPQFDPLRADVGRFLQAVADAQIENYLAGAISALEEPEPVGGHQLAQRAAEEMDKLIGRCNGINDQGEQDLTAHFKPKLSQPGLGNTLRQILAALNTGNGQGGRDGYGLFNEDVALYGPNIELAGEQAGGGGAAGGAAGPTAATLAGAAPDAGLPAADTRGRVRLQPDAKFPLRYRDLVGEYFRVMAESGKDGEKP